MNAMLYLLLLLSLILCCVAASQNSALAQANPPATLTAPAPPPLPPSPVDTFRKILSMPEPEREKFLTTLPLEKRQIVALKLGEYQGMPADEREKRLRALQVRVWVRQLIKLPQSNRVERLATVQPAERQMIESRLAAWDQLPANLQQEVITNELAIKYIASQPDSTTSFNLALPPVPPDPKMAGKLNHWRNQPEGQRAEILKHFETFFEEFTPGERAKIMDKHQDLARSVTSIANLTKDQRERYIAGFKRFAALPPAERQKFLMKAARWQKMTPEERDSWRILAQKLAAPSMSPPPLPGRPGASLTPAADHASLDLPSQ